MVLIPPSRQVPKPPISTQARLCPRLDSPPPLSVWSNHPTLGLSVPPVTKSVHAALNFCRYPGCFVASWSSEIYRL